MLRLELGLQRARLALERRASQDRDWDQMRLDFEVQACRMGQSAITSSSYMAAAARCEKNTQILEAEREADAALSSQKRTLQDLVGARLETEAIRAELEEARESIENMARELHRTKEAYRRLEAKHEAEEELAQIRYDKVERSRRFYKEKSKAAMEGFDEGVVGVESRNTARGYHGHIGHYRSPENAAAFEAPKHN